MLGEYPIYSADWHGISLLDIASAVGLKPGQLPDDRFYAELYREWGAREFYCAPEFRSAKVHIGDVAATLVRELAPKAHSILSVGVRNEFAQ